MISIDQALLDKNLLGSALGNADSWATWLTTLRAAFGLDLDKQDRKTFRGIAGDRKPPTRPCRELWVIAGRRSGKSRMAAAVATYLAAFQQHKLAKGETGHVLVLSPTLAQSRTIFGYTEAFLQASPILARKVRDVTASEIRLDGNIIICHSHQFVSFGSRSNLVGRRF